MAEAEKRAYVRPRQARLRQAVSNKHDLHKSLDSALHWIEKQSKAIGQIPITAGLQECPVSGGCMQASYAQSYRLTRNLKLACGRTKVG